MATNKSAAPKPLMHARRDALMNGRYHGDRESFLEFWDRVITFGVLVTGAVAFFDVFGTTAQKLGAAFLGLFALVQIVFQLSKAASTHGVFKRQYFDIAAEVQSGSLSANDAFSRMSKLAGEEGAPFCALHALAENWATASVYGSSKSLPCEVGFIRKRLRNLLRQEEADFRC